MHSTPEMVSDISKAIQLALGPVFLLTGIASLLNVMTGRLSRIIDRGRQLTETHELSGVYSQDEINAELILLEKRRRLTSRAITMGTVAALMVCLVIFSLFFEVMMNIPLNWVVGAEFSLATLALVIGLGYYLREVHLASTTIRIKIQRRG